MRKFVVALLAFSMLSATAVFADAKTVPHQKSRPKVHSKAGSKRKASAKSKGKKGGFAASKRRTAPAKPYKRLK